jgi:hypothetical protein
VSTQSQRSQLPRSRGNQLLPPPNMALQRTRRPRLRSGRSLGSLGSPLYAYPLAGRGTGVADGG